MSVIERITNHLLAGGALVCACLLASPALSAGISLPPPPASEEPDSSVGVYLPPAVTPASSGNASAGFNDDLVSPSSGEAASEIAIEQEPVTQSGAIDEDVVVEGNPDTEREIVDSPSETTQSFTPSPEPEPSATDVPDLSFADDEFLNVFQDQAHGALFVLDQNTASLFDGGRFGFFPSSYAPLSASIAGTGGDDVFLLRGRMVFSDAVQGTWINGGAGGHDVILYDGGSIEDEAGRHFGSGGHIENIDELAFSSRLQAYGIFAHAMNQFGHELVTALGRLNPPAHRGSNFDKASVFSAASDGRSGRFWVQAHHARTAHSGKMGLKGVDMPSASSDYQQTIALRQQGVKLVQSGNLDFVAATHIAKGITSPSQGKESRLVMQGFGTGLGLVWHDGGTEAGLALAGTSFDVLGHFYGRPGEQHDGYHLVASLHASKSVRLGRGMNLQSYLTGAWQKIELEGIQQSGIPLSFGDEPVFTGEAGLALKIARPYGGHVLTAKLTHDGDDSYLATGMVQTFDPAPQMELAWGGALTKLAPGLLVWAETGMTLNLDTGGESPNMAFSLRYKY